MNDDSACSEGCGCFFILLGVSILCAVLFYGRDLLTVLSTALSK